MEPSAGATAVVSMMPASSYASPEPASPRVAGTDWRRSQVAGRADRTERATRPRRGQADWRPVSALQGP
jgi:hypothetical protein